MAVTTFISENDSDRQAGDGREASGRGDCEVLDFASLLDRCMGNLDLAQRLLDKFEHWLPEELANLEQALALEDSNRIAQVAHRIKGSSANIAAQGLQRAAAEIVDVSRAGRMADLSESIDRLRQAWMQYLAGSASGAP